MVMADGVSPELDPLLDEIARFVAVALDLDMVRIDLFALGHPDVSLVGTHGPGEKGYLQHERRVAETSISEDGSCAWIPIPGTAPPGVLQLERSSGLLPDHVQIAERVASLLGLAACRIAPPPERLVLADEVRIVKERRTIEALDRYGWNVARAARSLEVARSFVYRVARLLRERRRATAPRRA
jgi:hypothetical protein